MDGGDNCEMFPRYFLRVRRSRKLFRALPSAYRLSATSFSYIFPLLRVTLNGRRCITRRGITAVAPNGIPYTSIGPRSALIAFFVVV